MYLLDIPFNLNFNLSFTIQIQGFPYSSVGKESACSAGKPGVLIPGLGRSPGEGNGNPLQYPCLENLMDLGWRSLVGCSPLDHKEFGTTEWPTLNTYPNSYRECLPEFSKNLLLRNPRFISLTNYDCDFSITIGMLLC